MLEFILMINLAFSIVGFFFIVRMWKEVKTRRDYYGENFGIPRGKDRTEPPVPPNYFQQQPQGYDQIAQAVAAAMQAQKAQEQGQVVPSGDGDLQKIIAAVAAQNGGA